MAWVSERKDCARCGSSFETRSSNHKYCGTECQKQATHANLAGDRWLIFNRDGCRCIYCGRTAEGVCLAVDHIVPYSKGGPDCAGNLVTACGGCNTAKSSSELSQRTREYVLEVVQRRNEEMGIPPDKVIKGHHCRG